MIEHWEHEETIRLIVSDLYSHYRRYVLRDDIAQEAMAWWYGPGQEYLAEYLADDENFVRLRRSIWRFVAKFCETEEAHARGYEPYDQAFYKATEIMDFLPLALDPDAMPQLVMTVSETGITSKQNLSEGGNALVTLIDVRAALSKLAEDDVFYLGLCDSLAYDYERVAKYTNTQADSARRRHTRIAERMARWLNKKEVVPT